MCKHDCGVALYPPPEVGGFTATEDKFKCAAIDEDGRAFAFPCKAKQLNTNRWGEYKYKDGEYRCIGRGYDATDWQNSAIDRE